MSLETKARNFLQATCLSYLGGKLFEEDDTGLGLAVSKLAKELTTQFSLSDLCTREKIRRFVENVYVDLPFNETQKQFWTKKKLLNKLLDIYRNVESLKEYKEDAVSALSQNSSDLYSCFVGKCLSELSKETIEEEYVKACKEENEDMQRFCISKAAQYTDLIDVTLFIRIVEFFLSLFQRNKPVHEKSVEPIPNCTKASRELS